MGTHIAEKLEMKLNEYIVSSQQAGVEILNVVVGKVERTTRKTS